MKLQNILVENVDMGDYPDFCDAFISYAEDKEGNPLTEQQLDDIQNKAWYTEVVQMVINDDVIPSLADRH